MENPFNPKFIDDLSSGLIQIYFNEVEAICEKIGEMMVRETREVLTANNVNVTDELRKSIFHKVEKTLWGYLITISANVNYSEYVHDGTRPHYPPIIPIRDWVLKRGLASRAVSQKLNTGYRRYYSRQIKSYKSMDDYYKIDQIARSIAWKIYRKGTKGIKFFEIALKQAWPHIESEIKNFDAKWVDILPGSKLNIFEM